MTRFILRTREILKLLKHASDDVRQQSACRIFTFPESPWTYVSTMCVARGINSVWNNKKKQWKKNNKQARPQIWKITYFFRASKIKFGLVDFDGLLARLACDLKSFSWRLKWTNITSFFLIWLKRSTKIFVSLWI